MIHIFFKGRYSVLFAFICLFLLISFILRTYFFIESATEADFTVLVIMRIYFMGFLYDLGVALFLTTVYNLYLLFLPEKWSESTVNKVITYIIYSLLLLISFFSFFAEITFWNEFQSRFNFIAVDYLIYTYEVINNINESYPITWLLTACGILVLTVSWFFGYWGLFKASFTSRWNIKTRLKAGLPLITLTIIYPFLLSNSDAEVSNNRYENELSKAGVYSFFAAFRANELNYNVFYSCIGSERALHIVRGELGREHAVYKSKNSLLREIRHADRHERPNIIMITVESLSADFLQSFGNKANLTPNLDSMAKTGVLFSKMYATGTRTVRGMEALTLSVPPTPGNSIVRRKDNANLFTIGSVLTKRGYSLSFFYGGDGYFDNMNQYFGSNGFDIIDRGRSSNLSDSYHTRRSRIPDSSVQFENAWGICDEDLFNAVITRADSSSRTNSPFYNFIMTTSNHRPYTFPSGKIDMPQGSREAAVRYTDYAIGKFFAIARKKSWYTNTVFVIVADHCASSAGKNEIDVSKYHIPCIILNLPNKKFSEIDLMCSQIDLYPTLFGLLGWNYQSNLYGKDVLNPSYTERAFISTYQKLGYLKKDSLVILSPQRKTESFIYHREDNSQVPFQASEKLRDEAIAYYQSAYELFKSGKLREF